MQVHTVHLERIISVTNHNNDANTARDKICNNNLANSQREMFLCANEVPPRTTRLCSGIKPEKH